MSPRRPSGSAPPPGRLYLVLPGTVRGSLPWVPPGGCSSGLLTLNRGVGVRTPGDACARPAAATARGNEEEAHVFAGIDTHKDTLAVAVIDTAGRVVHQSQHPNHDDGYQRLLAA